MLRLNHVVVAGRVLDEPRTKRFGEHTILSFKVGLPGKKKQDGTWDGGGKVPVDIWDNQWSQDNVRQGVHVCVEGKLEGSEWTSGDDTKWARLYVKAWRVDTLDYQPKQSGDTQRQEHRPTDKPTETPAPSNADPYEPPF